MGIAAKVAHTDDGSSSMLLLLLVLHHHLVVLLLSDQVGLVSGTDGSSGQHYRLDGLHEAWRRVTISADGGARNGLAS